MSIKISAVRHITITKILTNTVSKTGNVSISVNEFNAIEPQDTVSLIVGNLPPQEWKGECFIFNCVKRSKHKNGKTIHFYTLGY